MTSSPMGQPQEHALLTNLAGRDVVVLGAGFSKAVDGRFPLTDDLGRSALTVAGLTHPGAFAGGSFEAWLSYLAEAQPFLREEANLANRALFTRLVGAIHEVLCDIEAQSTS
jgi:hypothetical protein